MFKMPSVRRWWARHKEEVEANTELLEAYPDLKRVYEGFEIFEKMALFSFIILIILNEDAPVALYFVMFFVWTVGVMGIHIFGYIFNHFRRTGVLTKPVGDI